MIGMRTRAGWGLLSILVIAAPAHADQCADMGAAQPLVLPAIKPNRDSASSSFDFPNDARCIAVDTQSRGSALLIVVPDTGPAQITVTTVGDRKRGIMPLRLRTLDAERALLAEMRFDRFVQRGMQHSIALHVRADSPYRYLLIDVDNERLGGSSSLVSGTRFVAPLYAAGVGAVYANGSESTISMPFVDQGRIEVRIERTASTR